MAAPEEAPPLWLAIILAAMGPGLVTAMAGNDAGGIATYSQVGALFGYSTLWALPIMCVLLIVVHIYIVRCQHQSFRPHGNQEGGNKYWKSPPFFST